MRILLEQEYIAKKLALASLFAYFQHVLKRFRHRFGAFRSTGPWRKSTQMYGRCEIGHLVWCSKAKGVVSVVVLLCAPRGRWRRCDIGGRKKVLRTRERWSRCVSGVVHQKKDTRRRWGTFDTRALRRNYRRRRPPDGLTQITKKTSAPHIHHKTSIWSHYAPPIQSRRAPLQDNATLPVSILCFMTLHPLDMSFTLQRFLLQPF
jgi:hypothetical protein